MTAKLKVRIIGHSGAQYEFNVYRWNKSIKAISGICLVLNNLPDGGYNIMYISQNIDLREHIENNRRITCIPRIYKTHIGVLEEYCIQKRRAFVTDIIRHVLK